MIYQFNNKLTREYAYDLLNKIRKLDKKYLNQLISKMLKYRYYESNIKIKKIELTRRDPLEDKFIGIKNLASISYLNSLFQQLFMNPFFSNELFKLNIENNKDYEKLTIYNMQDGFANLKYSSLTGEEMFIVRKILPSFWIYCAINWKMS